MFILNRPENYFKVSKVYGKADNYYTTYDDIIGILNNIKTISLSDIFKAKIEITKIRIQYNQDMYDSDKKVLSIIDASYKVNG